MFAGPFNRKLPTAAGIEAIWTAGATNLLFRGYQAQGSISSILGLPLVFGKSRWASELQGNILQLFAW